MIGTSTSRIAVIGNSLPRKCGIATFTTDLSDAIGELGRGAPPIVVAMTDEGRSYDYPPNVAFTIQDRTIADYAAAAAFLNASNVDVVSLQHEFGIFGGEGGAMILSLLNKLDMPVVTTLHTVLESPSPACREVMHRLIMASSTLVVMADKGAEVLARVYGVPEEKIVVIPHGIPDVAFCEPDAAKARLGFSNRTVILTFGLLSPNKGIEVMIAAMPRILRDHPDAVYVVLGATHPNLLRKEGEAYRESLEAMAARLGVAEHVVFLDQFVDKATLLEHISMCDVYVTPYLNEAQMTSGTLAYSYGMGKAVVSSPYWHAAELLAGGRGILVPFGDTQCIGDEISALLSDEPRRRDIRCRAYEDSRAFVWARTAEQYLTTMECARIAYRRRPAIKPLALAHSQPNPQRLVIDTSHLLSMCDDVGMLQHARHCVADRNHGYCIDDNARALLLSCTLAACGEPTLPDALTSRFASFIQQVVAVRR